MNAWIEAPTGRQPTPPTTPTAKNKRSEAQVSPLLIIAKREFRSYFDSPLAYVVICLSYFGLGLMFFNVGSNFWRVDKASLTDLFVYVGPGLSGLVVPVVTMALLAEERRSGTLEMLITLPVKDSDVVLGKYIGALGLVLALLLAMLLYPITMFSWPWHLGNLDWGPVRSAMLGLFLFSGASVAIGLLISSVTKSQAVAFFVTFFVLVMLWMMGEFTDYVGQEISQSLANVMSYISFNSRLQGFIRGLVDTRDIVYFISVAALALVFAFRSLERRKWA
jgi:ABC-2 type transport system permease protein